MNKELLRYANDHNHVYFVTAQELSANPDGIHLNAVSQRKFGVRYYYAYKNKKNVITPLKNEEKLLESCINIPYTQNEMKYLAMMDQEDRNVHSHCLCNCPDFFKASLYGIRFSKVLCRDPFHNQFRTQ